MQPLFSEAAKECRRRKKEYVRCLETRVAVLENQNKQLIEELQALKEMYVHKHVGSTGVVHAQDPTMVSLPKQVGGYSDQPPQHTLEHVLETAAAQASSSHAGGDAPQIHGKKIAVTIIMMIFYFFIIDVYVYCIWNQFCRL